MNLMFWKKKTGTGEEAENAREDLAASKKLRESLDFSATKQGIADTSRDPESPELETPAKPGLAARMALLLTALTSHFKKTPAFSAEEDHAPEASEGSKKPVDAAAREPDLESPDMEVPAEPGLVVRAKLLLIALTRRFKKSPISDVAEGDEEDAFEINPVRSKKRLIIGGAIGLLVLLLASIGFALWPAAPPHQEQPDTGRDVATTRPSQPAPSEPAPGEPQPAMPEKPPSEIEALKKENAELHARIEALKKELPQQQPYVPAARHDGGNAPSSSASGEMMIGNKDPKDTAMTLKEAIEAMNTSSGDHAKKTAK